MTQFDILASRANEASDWVGISLDALGTGQLSYHLMVNPSGVQLDMLNSVAGGEDDSPDYDPVDPFQGRTQNLPDGSLLERREYLNGEWIPGRGDYLTSQRGLFFEASYLHRF